MSKVKHAKMPLKSYDDFIEYMAIAMMGIQDGILNKEPVGLIMALIGDVIKSSCGEYHNLIIEGKIPIGKQYRYEGETK